MSVQTSIVLGGMHFGLALLAAVLMRWTDLSIESQKLAREMGMTSDVLPRIERRTAERLREGELDHLIFYMLQSQRFTSQPRLEPARAGEQPEIVRKRIEDLQKALEHPADERQRYFAALAKGEDLWREWIRVSTFLHMKEVECGSQECVANLYQQRGHSSDTSADANVAVKAAIQWIGAGRVKRVLLIGPGLDWAPRTRLREEEPRMYQPEALRAALPEARIECADINPRVVEYARKSCDGALQLNAVIQRADARYDLIVATNVLVYMDAAELLLAMNNVRAMLSPGGHFVHNDTRFETKLFGKAAGLPAVHFETVTLDAGRKPPTIDHFVVHEAR